MFQSGAHKAGPSSSYRTRRGNQGGGSGDGSGSESEGSETGEGYRRGVVTRARSKEILGGKPLSPRRKGALAEGRAEAVLRRLGCEILPCKLPGNQGFDLIGVLKKANGEIEKIFIVESKFSKRGKFGLSNTVTKGKQMSKEWIKKTIFQMERSRVLEVMKTAKILKDNDDKWVLKGNVLNNQGTNRWGKATEKVKQVAQEERPPSPPARPSRSRPKR